MSDTYRIKNLDEVFKKFGIDPPKHPLVTVLDFSEISFPNDVAPMNVVMEYYTVALKNEQLGSINYGRQYYDYQQDTLVFIAPEQAVTFGCMPDKTLDKGVSLLFHPDLIRPFALFDKMNEYSFFGYQSNEALHVSQKEQEIILSIFDKITTELNSNFDDFSTEVIVTNIELLLNYSKRFYNRQFITRKSFNSGIVAKFERLLVDYFNDEDLENNGIPTVNYCADQLGLSPNYLSDMIKKNTDKSPLDHIHYHIIEKAKTHLKHSELSVSELAYQLGFEYPQYFSRLFKNKVGVTPTEYRNALN